MLLVTKVLQKKKVSVMQGKILHSFVPRGKIH